MIAENVVYQWMVFGRRGDMHQTMALSLPFHWGAIRQVSEMFEVGEKAKRS